MCMPILLYCGMHSPICVRRLCPAMHYICMYAHTYVYMYRYIYIYMYIYMYISIYRCIFIL